MAAPGTPALPNSPIGTLQGSLDDPAGNQLDFHGDSVALSPNGTTLVVGANGNNGDGAADAYIYAKGVSGFSEKPTATLAEPFGNSGSDFGRTVAVAGNTVAVGSPYPFGGSGGLVYLYVKGPAGWPTTPTVTLTDPGTGSDEFGWSVAVAGNTLVVGAPATDGGAGTEYIYQRTGGIWPTTPTVISPNPDPSVSDAYGSSVGVSGSKVVVGAEGLAAIEHVPASGFPTTINRILLDPAGATAGESDFFGNTVAITGNTVVVGTQTQGASVAYIYQRGTTKWPTSPTVTLPDPPGGFPQDNFGISISASPGAIVIGDNDSGATGDGQAFIYTAIDGTWLSEPTATLDTPDPSPTASDQFGQSVAVAAGTVVVGAPGISSDSGAIAAGVAYLFSA
jgi:hypothetical protein